MKIIFLILGIVILLASCATESIVDAGELQPDIPHVYDGKFHFKPSAAWDDNKGQTKGVEVTNDNFGNFAVFAAMSNGEEFAQASHHLNWMYNAKIVSSTGKVDADAKWTYEYNDNDYYFEYWKDDAYHSFFAIAPYDIIDGNSTSAAGNVLVNPVVVYPKRGVVGSPEYRYTLPHTTIADGTDITVASNINIGGKDIYPANDGVVDLIFGHALSQIVVNVKLSSDAQDKLDDVNQNPGAADTPLYPNAKIKLHGIGFVNVATSGTMKYDTENAVDGRAPISWTSNSFSEVMQWSANEITHWKNDYIGLTSTIAVGSERNLGPNGTIAALPATVNGETHIALMMPQEFNANTQMLLAYKQNLQALDGSDGVSDVVEEVSLHLNPASGTKILERIEPGKKYVFDVTFDFTNGLVAMSVVATIFDWIDSEIPTIVEGGYFELENNQREYHIGHLATETNIEFETDFALADIDSISCSEGGTATFILDEATGIGNIHYVAPAGGLSNFFDKITFSVGNRKFEVHIFNGEYSLSSASYVIPAGEDSIIISYDSDYDINLINPLILFSYRTKNGGTVSLDYTNDKVVYKKPVDAEKWGITSDVITVIVAGASQDYEIFWGTFNWEGEDASVLTREVTMSRDVNQVRVPFDSNYSAADIGISVEHPLSGNVIIDHEKDELVYTSTDLSLGRETITITVNMQEYKVIVNMGFIELAEDRYEYTIDEAETTGVGFYTSFTEAELIGDLYNLYQSNIAGNPIDIINWSTAPTIDFPNRNYGRFEYTLTHQGGTKADQIQLNLHGRKLVYVVQFNN